MDVILEEHRLRNERPVDLHAAEPEAEPKPKPRKKPKIVVSDNRTYGTIRLHQERDFPDRVVGTDLANPDFARWGEAFGARGISLGKGGDVAGAVAEFLAHDGAAVLSVRSSAQAISAYTTIDALHERMRAVRAAE